MSRFFSPKYQDLVPYVPGEQPQDRTYIKLNTNESPFPPPPAVARAVAEEAERLALYPDPTMKALSAALSRVLGVSPEEVLLTNGSDEILNFAFMAFCDKTHPAVFPDVTYGFYSVFAEINRLPYKEIPLKEDFSIDVDRFCRHPGTVFLANPNAPTGIALPLAEIERILSSNPDRVVVIDEAYVDFGGESAVPLIRKYDNLLVTGTFSKSRSMAGARLGFGVASPALIRDLDSIKYSTNPYNINRLTAAAGLAMLAAEEEMQRNCQRIVKNRTATAEALRALGFILTDSRANFLFAKHPDIGGEELYLALKAQGILVRHFSKERIRDYNRITVGTEEQMQALLLAIRQILEERT